MQGKQAVSMRYLAKPYLTLFVYSVLYFLFFIGLYTIYTVYYLPNLQSDYELHVFYTSKVPTKMEILFSGFQSGYIILHSLVIGIILVLLAKKLNTFNYTKKGIRQILYTSFSWTTLYAALYFISELIWYISVADFSTSFSLGVIRAQLPYLVSLYFMLSLPIVSFLYWRH